MFVSALKARALPFQKTVISGINNCLLLRRSADIKFSNTQDVRTLFSMYSLGLEGFLKQGDKIRMEEGSLEGPFVKKMENILKSTNEDEIVYTEDLKKLVAYCQDNADYLDLILNLSKKYCDQIEHLNLKPFIFGPVIMRLLYIHKCQDKSLEVLLGGEFSDFFKQASSYQIAMDMLYKANRFESVLQLMDDILARKPFALPTSCTTLALAASYQLSSEESFAKALSLIRASLEQNRKVSIKGLSLAGKLALDRGKPQVALEILSYSNSLNHFLINNIHLLSKARLGCVEEVIQILRTRTLIDTPTSTSYDLRPVVCRDVIDEIEKLVNDKLEAQLTADFSHLKRFWKI